MSLIQQRANALDAKGIYLGGPVEDFEAVGRLQLVALLETGLLPESKVLDVGCGALRAGYWIMRFLNPGCYFGIEPNEDRLRVGLEEIIDAEVVERARPRFAHNDDFDLSVFDENFDYIIARSVWTHASKTQIATMLKSVGRVGPAILLTSYLPASRREDYDGAHWVGRSHESDDSGLVRHSRKWLTKECKTNDLTLHELAGEYNGQRWLRIERVP